MASTRKAIRRKTIHVQPNPPAPGVKVAYDVHPEYGMEEKKRVWSEAVYVARRLAEATSGHPTSIQWSAVVAVGPARPEGGRPNLVAKLYMEGPRGSALDGRLTIGRTVSRLRRSLVGGINSAVWRMSAEYNRAFAETYGDNRQQEQEGGADE